jgi:hypothetical protein
VDISKSLQATLHYYEHVANKDTPERAAAIVRQTQKLRKIVTRIENELESEFRDCLQKKSPHHASMILFPQLSKPRKMT